jgi:hypothetical protein
MREFQCDQLCELRHAAVSWAMYVFVCVQTGVGPKSEWCPQQIKASYTWKRTLDAAVTWLKQSIRQAVSTNSVNEQYTPLNGYENFPTVISLSEPKFRLTSCLTDKDSYKIPWSEGTACCDSKFSLKFNPN